METSKPDNAESATHGKAQVSLDGPPKAEEVARKEEEKNQ